MCPRERILSILYFVLFQYFVQMILLEKDVHNLHLGLMIFTVNELYNLHFVQLILLVYELYNYAVAR